MKRKEFVNVMEILGIGRLEFRIPWRGIGHYHDAKPNCIEPICKWHGLLEDCPRTRKENKHE